MAIFSSPLNAQHRDKYDDTPRTDIVDLIRTPPGTVLEIGCSAGATGLAVKNAFPGTHYTGLELDHKAAEIAASRLDRSIAGNIESLDLAAAGLLPGQFDLVICADVLEHLYDPWKALRSLRDLLKPAGRLIASIPNTQNLGVILQLIQGNWSYADCGLLDATHIRFFTLEEIKKLFTGSGYTIRECMSKLQQKVEGDQWPRDLDFGKVLLRNVTRDEAFRFSTFQYMIVAERME